MVIVGPTASGKSELGVKIAKKMNSEIISADSRQVYRGMDIGTGKITKKEMRGIAHHLIDVISPKKDFNVTDFKKLAEKKIGEISKRGKVPIIVGGAGFWIDALIYDQKFPEVAPDKKLRAKLEKQSAEQLFAQLKKLDPKRAKTIESRNKRRLVRALEILIKSKKPVPPRSNLGDTNPDNSRYDLVFIGIKKPAEELNKLIYERLIKRLKEGMVDEVKKLHKNGISWKRLDNFGLEYRYISRYLRGQLEYDEMVSQLYQAIKNYAKRQMTWFKRNKEIHWLSRPEVPKTLTA